MSKFNAKPGSGDKGRSGSRGDKKPFGKSSSGEKGGKKEYKATRSFTKNKSYRENQDADDKPRRSFSSDSGEKKHDRPFKRSFGDKPERSSSKTGERRPFKKDDAAGDKPRRSYSGSDERKPFKRDGEKDTRSGEKPRRSYGDADDRKPFKRDGEKDTRSGEKPRRSYGDADDRKPFKREARGERSSGSEGERPKRRSADADERKPFKRDDKKSTFGARPRKVYDDTDERKPYKKEFKSGEGRDSVRPVRKREEAPSERSGRPFKKRASDEEETTTKRVKYDEFEDGEVFSNAKQKYDYQEKKKPVKKPANVSKNDDGLIRLNKYLSNAGIASRREADNLIQSGVVKVNGVVVDQLGYKINPGDKVTYADAAVKSERKVYLLLNKPKDYITTLDDPQERKTVMELIKGACRERVYPVGRLDRNTTGLLLFTNDGELTTKLTHPKFGIKKVYHVSLNKGLKAEDFSSMVEGVELEDGIAKADDLAFVGEGKKEIGIEIHSGRNRIVRRLFEHLGYDVLKLDRVVFAGLTKKDLPRGKYRFLTAKEIAFLQMIA